MVDVLDVVDVVDGVAAVMVVGLYWVRQRAGSAHASSWDFLLQLFLFNVEDMERESNNKTIGSTHKSVQRQHLSHPFPSPHRSSFSDEQ